jgi:hypothetical protein
MLKLTVIETALPVYRHVCAWCVPMHVTQEGVEPTSHGMCPEALAKWMAALDALEALK